MVTTEDHPASSPMPQGRREPSSQDLRRRRATLGVVVAALAFGVLAVVVRVGWAPLQSADNAVVRALNDAVAPRPGLVRALTVVTNLGSAGLLSWLVMLTGIVLVVRRRFRLAAYLAVTAAGTLVLDPGLKALIARLRPVVPDPVAVGGGNSFPSGHALDSLVCYGALVLVLLPAFGRHRRWVMSAVGGVIVLIGLSRVMLGVHFVSDVVGAWCLGIAWLGLTVYAFEVYRNQIGRPVPRPLSEGVEPEAAADVEPTEAAPTGQSQDLLRTAAWLVVGWVLTLGLVTGLGTLATGGGRNLLGDRQLPAWLADQRNPTLNTISDFWSQAGNTHAIMAVGLICGAVALGVIRRWHPVVFLVVLMFGELGLFLASAKIVGRERPAVAHLDGPLPTSAYPSGHLAATLCLYVGITLLVMPRTRAWWRWPVLIPAVGMPILVGLSRMYRGMHHPTDVFGSGLLAAAWICIAYFLIRPHQDQRRSSATGPETSLRTAAVAGPKVQHFVSEDSSVSASSIDTGNRGVFGGRFETP